MKALNLFSYSIFLIALSLILVSAKRIPFQVKKCTEIEARTEVTDTKSGLDNGSVVIIVNGNASEFDAFLIIGGDYRKLKDMRATAIAKGNYALVIKGKDEDTQFCPKYFSVKVE